MREPGTEAPPLLVGDGALPADLLRPNWVAFVFTPIWAIAYRFWPVLWLFVGLVFLDVAISNTLLWRDPATPTGVLAVTFYMFQLLWRLSAVAVAVFGNRWLWSRTASQRAQGRATRPLELARYRDSIRSWTPFAVAVLALELVNAALLLVQQSGGAIYAALRVAAILGLLGFDRYVAARGKANNGIEPTAQAPYDANSAS